MINWSHPAPFYQMPPGSFPEPASRWRACASVGRVLWIHGSTSRQPSGKLKDKHICGVANSLALVTTDIHVYVYVYIYSCAHPVTLSISHLISCKLLHIISHLLSGSYKYSSIGVCRTTTIDTYNIGLQCTSVPVCAMTSLAWMSVTSPQGLDTHRHSSIHTLHTLHTATEPENKGPVCVCVCAFLVAMHHGMSL